MKNKILLWGAVLSIFASACGKSGPNPTTDGEKLCSCAKDILEVRKQEKTLAAKHDELYKKIESTPDDAKKDSPEVEKVMNELKTLDEEKRKLDEESKKAADKVDKCMGGKKNDKIKNFTQEELKKYNETFRKTVKDKCPDVFEEFYESKSK